MFTQYQNKILQNKKGQNVIEYLLLTAIVALICIIFFSPTNGPMKSGMENVFNDTVKDIDRLRDEIKF